MEQEDGLSALRNFAKKHDDRAAEWLTIIETMLSNYERYSWAEETLIGIYDHIMENNTISDKQIQAVKNIRNAPHNHRW